MSLVISSKKKAGDLPEGQSLNNNPERNCYFLLKIIPAYGS